MIYPESIKILIESFKKLPGIGEKTAERLALSVLDLNDDIVKTFATSLINVKNKIKACEVCNNLTEEKECIICANENRNKSVICVVEEAKNVILFEKTGAYKGLYHVLNGLISPLEGINPSDINIESLLKRIENNSVNEIIIALKPSIEGETTSLYISKLLKNKNLKISKIAHGIPYGADMDYIDSLTLEIALEDRKDIS